MALKTSVVYITFWAESQTELILHFNSQIDFNQYGIVPTYEILYRSHWYFVYTVFFYSFIQSSSWPSLLATQFYLSLYLISRRMTHGEYFDKLYVLLEFSSLNTNVIFHCRTSGTFILKIHQPLCQRDTETLVHTCVGTQVEQTPNSILSDALVIPLIHCPGLYFILSTPEGWEAILTPARFELFVTIQYRHRKAILTGGLKILTIHLTNFLHCANVRNHLRFSQCSVQWLADAYVVLMTKY